MGLFLYYHINITMSNKLKIYNDKVKNFVSTEQFIDWLFLLGDVEHITENIRQKENYVKGCQSDVWITVTRQNDTFNFIIDSDINFVRGIGKILTEVYSGYTAEEISKIKFAHFKNIAQYLTLPRKKGMQIMINKIHNLTKD